MCALFINCLPRSVSAVGVRVASRRSLRGELHDAPGDCCLQLLDPLDAPGDSLRTAKSHSISTASCLLENNMEYWNTMSYNSLYGRLWKIISDYILAGNVSKRFTI